MVGADGVFDGLLEFGLDTPGGVEGGLLEGLALGTLEDELHGALAAEGVELAEEVGE